MKKVTTGAILGMAVLLTACVSDSVNVAENKKENRMREEATIDISRMPIQTYEEYIKLKKFVLERYIKEANNRGTSGVAYLNDGTKIKYAFNKSEVSESIYHRKKPFVKVMKIYYWDSENIQDYMESISNLWIGKTIFYSNLGQIIKQHDEDAELRALGLDYKKILEWADEHKIIDLKEAKMLKGNSFKLQKTSFEKSWKTNWSKEEKRAFQKKNHLSDEVIKNLFSHTHYWYFTVDYPRYQETYTFSADGSFVDYFGKTYKMDGIPE